MGIFYGNSTSQSHLIADLWRSTTSHQGNTTPLANWERADSNNQGYVGGMSESSGIFTFPQNGIYLVTFHCHMYLATTTTASQRCSAAIRTTTNNSNYYGAAYGHVHFGGGGYSNSLNTQATASCFIMFDVTDTSNQKVQFEFGAGQGGEYTYGSSSTNDTYATFLKVGDT